MAQLKIRYGGQDMAIVFVTLENVTIRGSISAANTAVGQVGEATVNGRRGGDIITAGVDSSVDQTLEIIMQLDTFDEVNYHDRRYLGLRDVLVELLS